jgi:hypothetical protein
MSVFNKKSKEELDIEAQMNIKLLKKKAEEYAKKCDYMASQYDSQRDAAKEIGNESLEGAFLEKAKNLRIQASKIRSFILIVNDIGMMKDQSVLMNSFAETMKSYVKSMGRGNANGQWMSQIETQLDKAINESERVGDLFGGLIQDVGTNLNFELDSLSLKKNENTHDNLSKTSDNVDDLERKIRDKIKGLDVHKEGKEDP